MKNSIKILLTVLTLIFTRLDLDASEIQSKIIYPFINEPVDVVIPSTYKDVETLNLCIEGIRSNCTQVRRIIVVSPEQLTDKAEWFDEKNYPFSKQEVSLFLNHLDPIQAEEYLTRPNSRCGWYFQQLLKFYASYVIPNISSNVLILDSDTIFLKPVVFTNSQNAGLYNVSIDDNKPYFTHGAKLIPGFKKIFLDCSGISHHMLFQKCVLDDLFDTVRAHHQMDFWQAYCLAVDEVDLTFSGSADYEVYFNFLFSRTDQGEIRRLKNVDIISVQGLEYFRALDFDYVSCHAWSRQ